MYNFGLRTYITSLILTILTEKSRNGHEGSISLWEKIIVDGIIKVEWFAQG